MKFLLTLNRFEKDKNKLIQKLSNLKFKVLNYDLTEIIVEGNHPEEILNLNEISNVSKIIANWKDMKSFDFKEIKKDALLAIKDSKKKKYKIKTKFKNKTKFSSKTVYKHINPFLKHEGFLLEENPEVIINIEFKKENNYFYRISYSLTNWLIKHNNIQIDYSNLIVILENPTLVEEISDFLRLCWVFKIPLYILTNKNINIILNKAKKITKGIEYDKMNLFIIENLPKNYILIGFSKLAKDNEISLKKELILNQKMALVFGDDKFGLTQEIRDKINKMFRLTPEIKKPLRASHALSYVLGIYASTRI